MSGTTDMGLWIPVGACGLVSGVVSLPLTRYWRVFRALPRLPLLAIEGAYDAWHSRDGAPGWPHSAPLLPFFLLYAAVAGPLEELAIGFSSVEWIQLRYVYRSGRWWCEMAKDTSVIFVCGASSVVAAHHAFAAFGAAPGTWALWVVVALVWYGLVYPYLEWRGWGGD